MVKFAILPTQETELEIDLSAFGPLNFQHKSASQLIFEVGSSHNASETKRALATISDILVEIIDETFISVRPAKLGRQILPSGFGFSVVVITYKAVAVQE